MAPKKANTSPYLYLVVTSTGVDSVHASIESADARATAAKSEGRDAVKVEVQQLVGGDVVVHPVSAAESKSAWEVESQAC